MANSVDPDQLASKKPTFMDLHHFHRVYPGSAGLFVCVEVLRSSQPSGVMSSAVSLPNHTFTGQA